VFLLYINCMDIGIPVGKIEDRDITVTWMPGYSHDSRNHTDFAVAEVLSACDSLYAQLDRIRAEIGLEELLVCPIEPSVDDINTIIRIISETYKNEILKWSEWLSARYSLSNNWNLPFLIAIACHVLPVPQDSAITFFAPSSEIDSGGILEYINKSILEKGETTNYLHSPLISLKYSVTINEIKSFIEDNKVSIRKALEMLPPKPDVGKTKDHKLFIGQLAWLLRRNNSETDTWGKVASFINDKDLNNGEVLDEIEALKASNLYIRQRNKLDAQPLN
jgi:hypothetical protein